MNLKSIHGTLALLVIAGLGCDIARAQEDEFIKHAAEIVGGGISFDSGFATLDRVEVHFKALLDLPPVIWYPVRSSGGGAGGAGAGANPSDAKEALHNPRASLLPAALKSGDHHAHAAN